MNLLFLFCLCILVFAGILIGIRGYVRLCPAKFLSHEGLTKALALYLGLVVGGGVLCFLSFWSISVFSIWMLAGLAVLGIESSTFPQNWKMFLSFLICFGVVINLYPFSNNIILGSLLMSLLYWGAWRIFVLFDRFPLTSFIVSLGWLIPFVAVGLLVRSSIINPLVAQIGLLGTGVFALIYCGQPVLGKVPASLVGFMWAGVWGYFLIHGAIFQTIIGWGYYVFETIILGIAFLKHKPIQTLLGHLLRYPKFASKAIHIVISHLLILGFLSAMTLRMNISIGSVLFLATVIVLADLYLRLKTLENPQPTWRELLKGTKEGVIASVKEWKKKKVCESKSNLKKELSKTIKQSSKKVTSKKKTIKKKKVKK